MQWASWLEHVSIVDAKTTLLLCDANFGFTILCIFSKQAFLRTWRKIAQRFMTCSFSTETYGFVREREGISLGPAKVNKVKIFSRPCYMIKRLLTFVSGVLESLLVDYICQNKVKTSQNCLHQKFPCKNEQI